MTDKEAIEVLLRKEKETEVKHQREIKELQIKIVELKAEIYDQITDREELEAEVNALRRQI